MESVPFTGDISPKPLLYGLTLRSPVARGRLRKIECPRLPGSFLLITAADIPGKNTLVDFPVPVLAGDELSYAGEPVGILAGPDQAKLKEYADRIRVIAEEDAQAPVFTGHGIKPGVILAERNISSGDTGAAFAEAATVTSGEYKTGIQEHWYAEPLGAVALYTPEEAQITIRTATQWPYHVKHSAAAVLDIAPSRIFVESTAIGLHMDGKIWYPSLVSSQAALVAFIMKKNVKLVLTREEDFLYSPKRNASEIQIRSALGEKGELLALEINVEVNLGAGGIFAGEILDQTCLGALGNYRTKNLKLSGKALGTNLPPQGPLSGFGLAQGLFAMERHVSRTADILRADPGEWRKNNHIRRGDNLAIGVPVKDPPPVEQLLDTASAMSDYRRKWASYELLRQSRKKSGDYEQREPLRGIGIASAWQGSGFLYTGSDRGLYSVELTLEKNGSLEIKTSMVTSNNSYTRIWGNLASEILAIDAGMVRVISGLTERVPDSGPASLSRNITVLTRLVESACLAIRKLRFRDPLPITVRRGSRPARGTAWEGVIPAGAVCESVRNDAGEVFDKNSLSRLSWAAAVVEVEIDPVTYTPGIRGVWLGVDGGKILLEERARRCLKAEVIQALGWAALEHPQYGEGRLGGEKAADYNIPDIRTIPPVNIDFIWNDTADPRGIGELPSGCVPAAFVQAASQAMDHPFSTIPLTALDIWEAGRLKKKEQDL
ncbi:MAG: molybdopterin-dependent oxidoreductase [Treponema sp.]|jgi:CO/xanthine dehydrogenase Mo-binding subunit|nr:molybdopterin-dependent oxidoreductase [Treponema sp.]